MATSRLISRVHFSIRSFDPFPEGAILADDVFDHLGNPDRSTTFCCEFERNMTSHAWNDSSRFYGMIKRQLGQSCTFRGLDPFPASVVVVAKRSRAYAIRPYGIHWLTIES